MLRLYTVSVLLLMILSLGTGCTPDGGRRDLTAQAFLTTLEAEDKRPAGGGDLQILRDATTSPAPFLRAVGVRGLGRLEQSERVEDIVPLLMDPDAQVRAEAVNALAQAVHRTAGLPALEPLLARIGPESDPGVLGVIARSLGRLSLDESGRGDVAGALLAIAGGSGSGGDQLLGAALGMESFARGGSVGPALEDRMRELARGSVNSGISAEEGARIRSVATAALGASGSFTSADMEVALGDPDDGVRLTAATRLGVGDGEFLVHVERALADPFGPVRLEAVRALDTSGAQEGCDHLVSASGDEDPHVRIAALDALARPCLDQPAQLAALTRAATDPEARTDTGWHGGAHAVLALASVDPTLAMSFLPDLVAHSSPSARAYGARAAGRLGDVEALRELVDDASPNVRTAAVQALGTLEGRDADPVFLSSLHQADDPQLVLTLAGLLGGTEMRAEATDAALAALERLSEARWHTLRDARMALLSLVEGAGTAEALPRVESYLRDFDPAVADRAASVMKSWTGQPYLGAPRPMDRLPLPTVEELREMEQATVILHMARGGRIEIRLFPFRAPTNALRLFKLARDGMLDGLTFHRVAANFVIQGGSPGANEFAGHGTYTRDEVGLHVQWRGTVGLSTRGRDTGDGQIYLNLVDNLRLDHDYTVLGIVTAGMDVAYDVLEGDVIERAMIRSDSQVGSGG
jgi:cyclophilin family peptidyl-prolyl cis-trans isomerase/HEAT repeat protein